MSNNYNTFLAILLSFIVIASWNFIFPNQTVTSVKKPPVKIKEYKDLETALSESKRVKINSRFLNGSIALKGFKVDHILFKNYQLTQDSKTNVSLFQPNQTVNSYFAEVGWISNSSILLPNNDTLWSSDKEVLNENDTITLHWDNKQGTEFVIKITLDDGYMFKIEQQVINKLKTDIHLSAYHRINKTNNNLSSSNFILYEGPIGIFDNSVQEISFKSLLKGDRKFSLNSLDEQRKWFGFSDKYWASVIILENNLSGNVYFQHAIDKNGDNKFQIGYKDESEKMVKANSMNSLKYYLFLGPKEISLLDHYEAKYQIILFDRILDFGNLYFITKPILLALKYLHELIGNFGLAIIALTVIIRIVTLPLSIKSFVSILKMKSLQPKIQMMKEMYKDDKMTLSKETSNLFKKHSVKPLAGCLPTILQVPIFFALYKVLLISIEMRHANFALWINDLSIPDPTNILNLFGLIPISLPLTIGVLPVILSITMIVQQKMNTTVISDKSQMMAMKIMPYVFVFVFASFPSGLIIYWIFSNIFTIVQQGILKRFIVFQTIS